MLEHLPPDLRIDTAWKIIVALRDAISIAKRGTITYEQSIRLLHDISPEIYNEVTDAIGFRNINELARYFEEQAILAQIGENREVTADQLMTDEISRLENLLNNQTVLETLSPQELKLSSKRLFQVLAARDSLSQERRLTEHTVLHHDFRNIDRQDLGAQLIRTEDRYVDYKLSNSTYLRVRLLHPERSEAITGADMIYEQHDLENRRIRFAFLQYKMWETGVLRINTDSREHNQLSRLQTLLCQQGFCAAPNADEPGGVREGDVDYRFPHCCAFLRPTDRLQMSNNKMISSGIHVPLCNTLGLLRRENGVIDKKYIRQQTITQELFEHLFNRGFIGSRYLPEATVRELYEQSAIINPSETVVIYASEVKETIV